MNFKDTFLTIIDNMIKKEIKAKTPEFAVGVIVSIDDKTNKADININGVVSTAPFMSSRRLSKDDINSSALVLIQPNGKKYIVGCNK